MKTEAPSAWLTLARTPTAHSCK